jgi:hypothetical protein
MKPNPILEEVWRIKDDLAREAGYDIHRFCENIRKWAEAYPHTGKVVQSAQELRALAAEEERKRAETSNLILKEQHPPKD